MSLSNLSDNLEPFLSDSQSLIECMRGLACDKQLPELSFELTTVLVEGQGHEGYLIWRRQFAGVIRSIRKEGRDVYLIYWIYIRTSKVLTQAQLI